MTGEPESPPIQEAILEAIRSEVAKIRTMLPGKVLSYDHGDQRASVQPTVKLARENPETGERETYMPEPIENVPVAFPSGGGFSVTFPLEQGDRVELQFASRSLDQWLASDADAADPVDPRRFDISDAVARPGIRAFANALASDRLDDGALVVAGQEIHLGSANPAQFVALADLVKQEIQDLASTVDSLVDKHNAHKHKDNTALIPLPAQETDSAEVHNGQASKHPGVDDVASSKVKSE